MSSIPSAENARQQHRYVAAILLVRRAELGDQVSLLELKRDQDVGGRRKRKQQVPGGHLGRGPEGDQKTEHERMPHQLVEQRRPERRVGYGGAAQRGETL